MHLASLSDCLQCCVLQTRALHGPGLKSKAGPRAGPGRADLWRPANLHKIEQFAMYKKYDVSSQSHYQIIIVLTIEI